MALQPVEMAVVAVEDGDAAGLQPNENFTLGVGDILLAGEKFQVHGLHRRDDRHIGAHHFCKGRNLARMVHADLEDGVAGIARHARQRQGHAPVIVERLDRGMGLARPAERQMQRLLGARLAHAAGHRANARIDTGAAMQSQLAQGIQRIVYMHQRRRALQAVRHIGDDCRCRT